MPDRSIASGVGRQWNLEVYASLPSTNWGSSDQGVLVLDNGDIWSYSDRVFDHQSGFEDEAVHLCKVTPQGLVRYMPTRWGHQDSGQSIQLQPLEEELPIFEAAYQMQDTEGWGVTDGKKIWLYTGSQGLVWEFDPETLVLKHVAGSRTFSLVPKDSHDGLQAVMNTTSRATIPLYHDGYLYFMQYSTDNDVFAYMRRMKTSGTYSVETYAFANARPETATDINPTTGLPYMLDPDWLKDYAVCFGFYEGYLWIVSQESLLGPYPTDLFDSAWALRRAPLDDQGYPGDFELIHYGLQSERDTTTPPTNNDNECAYEDLPHGTYISGVWNYRYPYRGTPDLEGYWAGTKDTGIIMDNGWFIVPNYSGAYFAGGYQQLGGRLIKFDLPTIMANYDGTPTRHDRADPIWETIVNASWFDETWSNWNDNVRDRVWNFRAGSKPLIPHPFPGSLAYNPNSYPNTLFFMSSAVSPTTEFVDDTGTHTGLICTLSPQIGASFEVSIIFEGETLKAYADAHGLAPWSAPDEVVLS